MDPIIHEMKKIKDILNSYNVANKMVDKRSNFDYEIRSIINTCDKVQEKELDSYIIYNFLNELNSILDLKKSKYVDFIFNKFFYINCYNNTNRINLSFMGYTLFDYSSDDIIDLSIKFINNQKDIILKFNSIMDEFMPFIDGVYDMLNSISINRNIKISTSMNRNHVLKLNELSFNWDSFQYKFIIEEEKIKTNYKKQIELIKKDLLCQLDYYISNKEARKKQLNLKIEDNFKKLEKLLIESEINESELIKIYNDLKTINDKYSSIKI